MELTAKDFRGAWAIEREIADALGPDAQFRGTARFEGAGEELAYHETGQLVLGDGTALQGERRYLWHFRSGGVEVAFEDGRPFHTFRFDAAEGTHPCGADFYEVSYDFSVFPAWVAEWRVTGPRKDYLMTSRYIREG
ncbi:DUF6314 family protein [Pseudoroseicyclus sp. H15]